MTPSSTPTRTITRARARELVEATLQAGRRIGFGVAVAVVDPGGHLIAAEREETAPFLAIDVATDKAWTAASYRVTTDYWNDYVRDHTVAPLSGLPRVLAVGGGYPLFEDGEAIGAFGVSGGNLSQDQEAALDAVAALGLATEPAP